MRPLPLGLALTAAALLAACARPVAVTEAGTGDSSSRSPSPPPVATSPSGRPAPTACPAGGALVTASRGESAMGYREMTLTVTNCGGSAFQVYGRPDVVVLDEEQKPLDVDVVASPHFTADPRRVTVRPGATATAVLGWRNTVTDATVVATSGAYLSVAPVPGAARQIVALARPMDLGNTGRLQAGPWM